MHNSNALMAVCFLAGLIGALFCSLAAWAFGNWGITALAGVNMAPALTLTWLYPRLVWGGIWGLAYFLLVGSPRSRRRWVRKGLLISLLPTLLQLFYFFPYTTPFGQMGVKLGLMTPLFVLLYNFIWGFFTGVFTRLLWGR
ncbi:MAG: hypothetical protein C0624_13495 [Desulfuromonas sp.]|nr:MAG: hypothetical protein C0624_13495 [Desulfuromonas sp.]